MSLPPSPRRSRRTAKPRASGGGPARWSFTPRLELLESRRVLTCVSSPADSGPGTLRQAILDANNHPGPDTITFCTGPVTIKPQFPGLPPITDTLTIDGTAGQACTAGAPTIVLDGSIAGQGIDGLYFAAGNSTVRGLAVVHFDGYGLHFVGTGGNTVECDYLGLDTSGQLAAPNSVGLRIETGANNNVIGGTLVQSRNYISGNTDTGLSVASDGNQIKGNVIGLDTTGKVAVGNGAGLVLVGSGNVIGGTNSVERNVISGNLGDGIQLQSGNNNSVIGNFIGTDVGGTVATDLGNVGSGVNLVGDSNTVGGTGTGTANVLSGNFGNGLSVTGNSNLIVGNVIGTDRTGRIVLPNVLNGITVLGSNNIIGGTTAAERNLISGNLADGINLAGDANHIWGNYIGTDVGGTTALPNGTPNDTGTGDGIRISGSFGVNNEIGGTVLDDNGVNLTRNLISGNLQDGVGFIGSGASLNQVLGNFIGTDKTGTVAIGNKRNGVTISDGAIQNTVGGVTLVGTPHYHAARNLISGNGQYGVHILNETAFGTTENLIQGNFIGMDVGGTLPLGNKFGVAISGGASVNCVGGTLTAQKDRCVGDTTAYPTTDLVSGNLISGNKTYGVGIFDRFTSNNAVQGNYIGTDLTGTTALNGTVALGNGEGVNVFSAASANVIGGTTPQDPTNNNFNNVSRNIISGNKKEGLRIYDTDTSTNLVQGNFIGTDVTGTIAVANLYGVELEGGATSNEIGGTIADGDVDPNTGLALASSRNLISGNTQYGVGMLDSRTSLNRVEGNYIGTKVNGTEALANGTGVMLYNGANGNIIGGTFATTDQPNVNRSTNVISGNTGDGVAIWGSFTSLNTVLGNLIGTRAKPANGSQPLGNGGNGVNIYLLATANVIGGTGLGVGLADNVIAANAGDGVRIADGAQSNSVLGNYIGTNSVGVSQTLGNQRYGVEIITINADKLSNNNVTGSVAQGQGNQIWYNVFDGVVVNGNNFTNASTHNTIRANSIWNNGPANDPASPGITLLNNGNASQPPPSVDSATYDPVGFTLTVAYSVSGFKRGRYFIDLFYNDGTPTSSGCDSPGGSGEGQHFLVPFQALIVPASGVASGSFMFTNLLQLQPNSVVTATATGPATPASQGNTSPFSVCMPISGIPAPPGPGRRPVPIDFGTTRPASRLTVPKGDAFSRPPAVRPADAGDAPLVGESMTGTIPAPRRLARPTAAPTVLEVGLGLPDLA
jgi:titin